MYSPKKHLFGDHIHQKDVYLVNNSNFYDTAFNFRTHSKEIIQGKSDYSNWSETSWKNDITQSIV